MQLGILDLVKVVFRVHQRILPALDRIALDYPERITPPSYPAHLEVRRVSTAGTCRLHSPLPFLSQVLQGQDIGLEEVGDRIWCFRLPRLR